MTDTAANPTEREPVLAEPTLEEYQVLFASRLRRIVEVDQPVVLITQAPRSGGTLLMRLFDGHPECHTIGHEFSFGLSPGKQFAPDTEAGWRHLHDETLVKNFRKGFGQAHANLHGDESRFPMLIPPALQRKIYDEQIAKIEAPTERDVMNAYLTSFFNAWLDNQNLYGRGKKWVTGFTPRVIGGTTRGGRGPSARKVDRFRELYPDGRLISVVRDPVTWYASAHRWSHRNEWNRCEDAIEVWCGSAQQALDLQDEHGSEFVVIVSFKDLLEHTETTMNTLAKHLGIRPSKQLHQPTFNQMRIRANSSFGRAPARVNAQPLERAAEVSEKDAAYIRERAWELYERAEAAALRAPPAPSGKREADAADASPNVEE